MREAHPKDSNWGLGHDILDPVSHAQRMRVAARCTSELKLSIPCVVDDMNDTISQLYNAWPERLYVIGKDKRILYKGGIGPFGFAPKQVDAFLSKADKNSDATKRARTKREPEKRDEHDFVVRSARAAQVRSSSNVRSASRSTGATWPSATMIKRAHSRKRSR